MNRRKFIAFSVIAASIGYSVGQILPKSQNNRLFLRPPGAVENFEALCIKCGQCIQVCPYHSIDLLEMDIQMEHHILMQTNEAATYAICFLVY